MDIKSAAGDFNQAMMDLGSIICRSTQTYLYLNAKKSCKVI